MSSSASSGAQVSADMAVGSFGCIKGLLEILVVALGAGFVSCLLGLGGHPCL